ncbi:MAG: protein kinase [Planctomycetes bacterium]|nr:protein kinase [Planctomycetota bacterium]
MTVPPPARAKADPFLGRKFAHYRIGKQIGAGPLASVYRAQNIRLDRTVALKILSEQVSREAPHLLDRLVSAARSAAGVEHPNVLATYFVGRIDGQIFIEMQYADDGSVHDLLQRNGRLPPFHAAKIIRDAANGLAAVHKKGLLHHGIRPRNLMRMKNGTLKLADIGLSAYHHDYADPQSDTLLASELPYIAPERLTGGTVDPRSDLYSLGATLFVLLTGHPPLDAPSQEELIRMFVQESVPSPHDYVPSTPMPLCKIVGRMLDKNPRQRYANCQDLIRDLNRFLESVQLRPTRSQPPPDVADAALAEPVLPHLILSDGERTVSSPPTGRELDTQCRKMLRRARAKRLRAHLGRVGTRLVGAAAVLGILYGLYFTAGKLQASVQVRREEIARKERIQQAAKLARGGYDFESQGNWQRATDSYSRSLDLAEDVEVRKRLEAVRQAVHGFRLEEKTEWVEAERLLKAVLPEILSKGEVSRRLRRIEKGKSYAALYASGKDAYKKKEWHDAVAALSQAADLASELRIDSDAAALLRDAKQRIALRQKRCALMQGLLSVCKAKHDPYALFAACQYYLASPEHARHHDVVRQALEHANLALASGRKDKSSDRPLSTVTLRRGGTVRGKVIERDKKAVVIEVEEGGEVRRRVFHPNDVVRTEPVIPAEVRAHQAEALCADIVAAREAPRPFQVLSKVGQLRVDFADTAIVTSADTQAARCGATLDALVSWAVPQCEVMCPDCEGTGQVICAECDGKGEKRVRCKTCENVARLPRCPKCRGSGLRLSGACSVCGGSGRIHCKRCNGKGCSVCAGKGKWTCRACGGKGRVLSRKPCTACGGLGKIAGKTCPKCHGKGKPVCPDCKGTGRQTCPVCLGKRWITIPCDACSKTGRVQCPTCKGTGKKGSL